MAYQSWQEALEGLPGGGASAALLAALAAPMSVLLGLHWVRLGPSLLPAPAAHMPRQMCLSVQLGQPCSSRVQA